MTDSPAATQPTAHDNPLLQHANARWSVPRYDAIRAEHVEPAMRVLLTALTAELEGIEAQARPDWPSLVEPIERLSDRLELTWGTVGHLLAVRNSPELRAAHEVMQAPVVEFSMRLAQSRPIYQAFRALRDGPEGRDLDPAQRRIVASWVRDADESGVGLDGAERDRFNALQLELAELGTTFADHVLDATKAWTLDLTTQADIQGLPTSLLQLTSQQARAAGVPGAREGNDDPTAGPWRVTLDGPCVVPFLQHSRRRDLREAVYRAYVTRASDGALDNQPLLKRILSVRQELARMLGFADYAELSLSSKMAPDGATVARLLEELRLAGYDAALRDLQDLRDLASAKQAPEASQLRHWDVGFWAERLREDRYDFSEEDLRPYFPLHRVLDGLFALASRLFGVTIRAADGQVPTWHADVRFFEVLNEAGEAIAAFFLDPYSRPSEKRGGAWMSDIVNRTATFGGLRLPVASLSCNQSPPLGNQPSLMTISEIETLFHEFGHGLQHMLTRVDQGLASGIRNIEWDAVELPSQFMENWCYHRETLRGLSGHIQTGETLPDELFARITAARTFRAGSDLLRQVMLAATDLQLHQSAGPGEPADAFQVYRQVAERTTVLPPLPEDRFLCSFTHIFAGGYAAGYYSYKWAEVLSADAFAAFEEAGLDDPEAMAATGRRFRDTVLALGGSVHPAEVFRAFRGRDPSSQALLRHAGLTGGDR
jgi:oligopeptidase A